MKHLSKTKCPQYIPLPEFDDVTHALNFNTPDCAVIGGCDIYTTKAAGADKKLYKDIENSLESQYASLLSFSASLSTYQAKEAGASLNLSRASPFGPLSQISSRRTFAYLIATLNASHPDYDFSHLLRPSDFRREKSLKKVMNTLDTTLYNLRPRHVLPTASEPPHWSTTPVPDIPTTPNPSEKWNPRMWSLLDRQMSLAECSIYCYAPEEDPFSESEDEAAIWSYNYFFFNKARKRVCYLYLRGLSMVGNETPGGAKTPNSVVTVRPKRPASGTWSLGEEETGQKRAKFWLGDRADNAILVGDEDDEGDVDEVQVFGEREIGSGEGLEHRGFEGLSDTGSESPCKGRSREEERSVSAIRSISALGSVSEEAVTPADA
ncbi:MAG: hypothetical protein Q9164_004028 [Protoblastenia rupestris]